MCVGVMRGHTGQVNVLMKVSETSFVSGSHDSLIILWRHSEETYQYSNIDAVYSLVQHNPRFLQFTQCPSILSRFPSDGDISRRSRSDSSVSYFGAEDEEEFLDAEEYYEAENDEMEYMDSNGARGADYVELNAFGKDDVQQ